MAFQSVSVFTRQFAAIRPVFARQSVAQRSFRIPTIAFQGFGVQRTLSAASTGSIPRKSALPFILTTAGVVGLGMGLSALTRPQIHCDSLNQTTHSGYDLSPPPAPTVNLYELSFGTVCGLCAGVFIKKGTKAIAFLLGGIFVVLQYLGSTSVVRIDWAKMGSRFENLFYANDSLTRNKRAPNVYSLWNSLVDFLTANFQQRASFLVGLALGLRIG